jgi:hypothetical protein
MAKVRITPLQKEVLSSLSQGIATAPGRVGSFDCEKALSTPFGGFGSEKIHANSVLILEARGWIEVDYVREAGRTYPQVRITKEGREVLAKC